ncbi:MAG: phenylalanine--tRNA ligase subunit beta [Bacteroidaceae bacterium]|nr:phenylalanine--tRNA ligase subunit beta [Bacteroidaceae bacterium]
MNISYNWLKEYVVCPLTAEEAAAALTSIGLEVGGVEEAESIRGGLRGLVVGHVLTCEPHPDSDHMHVCTVDLGTGQPAQIVCGAPNVAAGQKVIVATLGTKLYDGDKEFTIKKSKLRGVESCGMICAEDEIGVGTSHDGIMVLPQDTPVGQPAAEYFNLESDYILEVDITPNRADACSHYGVARDLYAYLVQHGYDTELHRPSVDGFAPDIHALDIPVRIENAEACPRYAAVTLTGCDVKESPDWLKRKLTAIGLRPINNIVDVTNYIMMAYGQPLHCFDADMIEGGEVVVRTLPEGTPFVTLDGEEHNLSERDLAICNANAPMCIAGVFGGKGSGTYDTTRNVLLESAYFHPTWIRKSARRHGLSTDASFRFERGIDPDGQVYALKAAALLIKELAGGQIAMDVRDVVARELPKTFRVTLGYKYLADLAGKDIPAATVKRIAQSLEMQVVEETADALVLDVPAYRVDVQRPCDVAEDILRIYGYNNIEIPTSVKSSLTVETATDRSYRLQQLVSEQLVGAGYREIMNNSLTREAYYADLKSLPADGLVRVLNPLSSDLGVMRRTLLFGGLESLRRNVNRKEQNLAFFEFGNVYHYAADRRNPERALAPYSESLHLGLWLTGKRVEGSWAHPDEDTTVFQLKAAVRNILCRLGVPLKAYVTEVGTSDLFSKSLAVRERSGRTVIELGIVAKAVTAPFALSQPVYFAELDWAQLMRAAERAKLSFTELTKYPAVSRDLALLVDKGVTFAQIEDIARRTEKKLLRSVTLFDVYEGKNLPAGKKSYAVNFRLQDPDKTMNDRQTDAIMQKIIQNLKTQIGAELR